MGYRRSRYLIRPRIQFSFAILFVACAGVVLLLHGLVLQAALADAGTDEARAAVSDSVLRASLVSALVLVPLSVTVALVATHRVVGPLYRFDRFLRAVLDGSQSAPCRIRQHDEFKDLCALLNSATEDRRARNGGPAAGADEAPDLDATDAALPATADASRDVAA